MTEENDCLTLKAHELDFIKYFISRYKQEFNEGNLADAHHDATAVVLFLDEIINPHRWEKNDN